MATITDEEWEEYKKKNNKVYGDEGEERRRRAIVAQRKKIVEEHNLKYKKGEVEYQGRLNSMSDYTDEERTRMHGFQMT
ncbi:crustapain-like [Lucilia sericata]|uniref:crustapain-like n=2 Tax=Lucilia sericata TaxID=13632 RepID=UPI0018A8345C|nr:crustapain-like [Lucilia sericata]